MMPAKKNTNPAPSSKRLQQGKIDRSLFADNANSYFTEQALQDFASSLGTLGAPWEFSQSTR